VFSLEVRTLILFAVIIECPIFLWMFFTNISVLISVEIVKAVLRARTVPEQALAK
jgi:hypothetical protein